jgi:hypothetical protein
MGDFTVMFQIQNCIARTVNAFVLTAVEAGMRDATDALLPYYHLIEG